MVEQTDPVALVTGASSGIGLAFAERLARDHYDLILVARRKQRLDELGQRLRASAGVNAEVLVADLSKPAGLRTVEARILAEPNLEILVNNAGFGAYMKFVELPADRAEELVQVKVMTTMRLTRAALPGMIARGRGAIINVSSRLAYSGGMGAPLPQRAVYAGSNAFLNVFTRLLHLELEGTGVKVQALCPGVVETEFHERVGAPPGSMPPEIIMSAGDLVEASLDGLERGELICLPALGDESILEKIHQDEKNLVANSRTGKVADRYKSK